jgi:fumarylacetoacetate (FAA) hydrolase
VRLTTFRDPAGRPRVGRLEGDRVVELGAPTMVDWLRGEGHEPVGRDHPLDAVRLLAPVPRPPSFRDFYAFEEHVATGWRLRGAPIPDAWYDAPAFYFSNPASIHGPDEPVRRPAATRALDFELELCAIVGEGGRIAGFTILNDWSARDVQRREVTVGLGPHKGKDFATSIGPLLVTPDELGDPDRPDLEATVHVDGELVTRTRSGAMRWTWPQLAAHAARDTALQPGDLLGSGTLGRGCLLELESDRPEEERGWLRPGQVVTLTVEGLGSLRSPVV